MNSKIKVLTLVSIIVLATIATSLVIATQLAAKADPTAAVTQDATLPQTSSNIVNATDNGTFCFNGNMGMGFGGGFRGMDRGFGGQNGFGGFGQIQVSSAFTQNVTNILNSSSDVQALFNQGYNVTSIKPVITTTVDGNGNLDTQATSANVVLQGTNGRALVMVDLTTQNVTKIITTTINNNPT